MSTGSRQQVLSTPIAEAAITGIANGMALAGLRPVVEIMFADFATLAADQLINFAAKFRYMYGERTVTPLTVRLVSGGGRGCRPTHSQSLETLFCGVPGLRVVALSQHNPASCCGGWSATTTGRSSSSRTSCSTQRPAHRAARRPGAGGRGDDGREPALVVLPVARNGEADVTLVTYGGMAGPSRPRCVS